MSKTFYFNLPGITCINCVMPLEKALNECKSLKIESWVTDPITKTLSITVDDNDYSSEKIRSILKSVIESVGIECAGVVGAEKMIRSRIIKGVIGTIFGAALIALTLTGVALPLVAMYAIVGGSSLLTLFLGAESYYDAIKKLVKAKTLTMDALFAVSTLAVIGVSIASFFVPWLPMMLEAGVLIFGFRQLGRAMEESIKRKMVSGLSFKDRGVPTVIKKIEQDLWATCSSSTLQVGDIIRVKRGEIIPIDGTCENENSSIYNTIVKGAIIPSPIQKGEPIVAGMKVPDHVDFIEITVSRSASQSYLALLDQEIAQLNTEKAPIETATNKILQYFVPGILVLAAISGVVIGILFNPALAIQCAISLLVSACPCTLGFITPLAVKIGTSKALENGVQFKSSKALQNADGIDVVVFDLTGTVTTGVFVGTDHQIYSNSTTPDEFFCYLAAIEKESRHPIAKAVCEYAEKESPAKVAIYVNDIDQTNHSGIKAMVNGECCLVGNIEFLRKNNIDLSANAVEKNHEEQIVYFVKNRVIIGHVKTKDPIREDARFTIGELTRMGIDVHICTGADKDTANQIAGELKIPPENVHANCMAASDNEEDLTKTKIIASLQAKKKRVAMVGDAENDAPAITKSDFGIAVKSNSSDVITQEQAGAVIGNSSLLPVVTVFAVAKQTVRSIKQNLIMSLAYNTTMVLIAGGVLVAVGFVLNPAIGVGLMVLQTTLVLLNQYRIKQQEFSHLKNFQVEKEQGISTYTSLQKNDLKQTCQPNIITTVAHEESPITEFLKCHWLRNTRSYNGICDITDENNDVKKDKRCQVSSYCTIM
jgi:P-type Cu2+ transporter